MSVEQLKVKIAGEIALSQDPGASMKKWREVFGIAQGELAEFLKISSSTISDYEGNRRKSPGIGVIHRFVDALFEIDLKKGGELVKRFQEATPEQSFFEAVDFPKSVDAKKFAAAIEAKPLTGSRKLEDIQLFGCTILDSVRVILEMPYDSMIKVYSTTNQRALLFTQTTTGRGPMIAVRMAPIKPLVVVLHELTPDKVDKLAVRIAENEGIPLLVTQLKLEEIKKKIESLR